MKKRVVAGAMVILAVLVSVVLIRNSASPKERKIFLIGMSQANLIEPWRVTMNLEFQQAAQNYDNLKVIYTDGAQDTQRQI